MLEHISKKKSINVESIKDNDVWLLQYVYKFLLP